MFAGSRSSTRLLTLKARQCGRVRSVPGRSSLTTSAPRSARTRPASQPSRSVASTIKTSDSSMFSAAGTRQRMHPAGHACLRVFDILPGEEVFRLDLVDRIDRTHEVALIAEGHGGIDAHTALELGVRCRPLLVAGGQAVVRDESLAAAAWNWVVNV